MARNITLTAAYPDANEFFPFFKKPQRFSDSLSLTVGGALFSFYPGIGDDNLYPLWDVGRRTY